MTPKEKVGFNYSLSNKGTTLVVTFSGPMDFSSFEKMQFCKNEIETLKDIHFMVLYFRDVPSIADKVIPFLAQIQINFRSRPGRISICSINPELQERLLRSGVIRNAEISENLQAALMSFSVAVKTS